MRGRLRLGGGQLERLSGTTGLGLIFCAHTRLTGLVQHPTCRQKCHNLQAVITCTHENHQEIRAGKELIDGAGAREYT